MSLYVYHLPTATDIKQWATVDGLQNMQNAYTTSNTFTMRFLNYKPSGPPDSTRLLPVTFGGGDKILYIDYTNSSTFRILGVGVVITVDGTDPRDNPKGTQTLTMGPPRDLKRIMEDVRFTPDPTTGYPDDRSRVLRLGVVANLTGWDWTSGISATPSVTYPVPPVGEAVTEYPFKSIEDILNDLATDPGRPGDTGYPVATRHWWIDARLTDDTDPSLGIVWVLRYVGVSDIVTSTLALKDRLDVPATPEPSTILYNTGATAREDWRNVIRDVYIAGPTQDPTPVAWQNATNVIRGDGFITKYSGSDGSWDAGAVSKQRMKGGDWEATAIVQEFYLCHMTFQVDDSDYLHRANTGQFWEDFYYSGDTIGNTIGARAWHGIPRLRVGIAAGAWDCHAATCILRSHFTTNRQGQALLFRGSDADNFWRVENIGGDYALIKRNGGSESTVGTLGVTPADGHEIKVFPLGSQIQVYVDDVLQLQVTGQTFNEHATKHGLYVNCGASSGSYQARFYDFQCTTFFSDDAFGIGTATSVTSWTDISYGFVKNNNGTLTIVVGGTTPATDDYSYNDTLRVSTALYFDESSASLMRMVTWEKLPYSEAEWQTLYTLTTGVVDMSSSSPWYVQFAGSDLGATLNNISLRKMYANRFHADPTIYGVNPDVWPANGLIKSDDLDTYVKRQTRADAIFRQSASPRITLQCDIPARTGAPPFALGDLVTVTNHGLGWVLVGLIDTRKQLYVTSIQRIETKRHLLEPSYRLTLESQQYDTDLSGQRHLLKGGGRTKPPDSRGVPTQNADDSSVFDYPDPTGDEQFGDFTEVQVARIDAGAYANAQQPWLKLAPDVSAFQLDKASLVPGAQYVLRTRNAFNSGLTSDVSESTPFIAPTPDPYQNPYGAYFDVGDGTAVITAGQNAIVTLPESGTITSWELISYDNSEPPVAIPATIVIDVQYADPDGYRQNGITAFASIAGTDLPTLTTAESADSIKLTGWTPSVKAGGKIRFVVLGTASTPTQPAPTAKKILLNLPIRRSDPT